MKFCDLNDSIDIRLIRFLVFDSIKMHDVCVGNVWVLRLTRSVQEVSSELFLPPSGIAVVPKFGKILVSFFGILSSLLPCPRFSFPWFVASSSVVSTVCTGISTLGISGCSLAVN